jgi:hypothetical protein
MLFGSDCNNNMLRDVTGVKRGDTVGLWEMREVSGARVVGYMARLRKWLMVKG